MGNVDRDVFSFDGYILDLTKVVKWARAERRDNEILRRVLKEAGRNGIFRVKQNEHVCYPVSSN